MLLGSKFYQLLIALLVRPPVAKHRGTAMCERQLCVYVHVHMCVAAGSQHQVSFSTLCFQIGSLTEPGAHGFRDGLANESWDPLSLLTPQC